MKFYNLEGGGGGGRKDKSNIEVWLVYSVTSYFGACYNAFWSNALIISFWTFHFVLSS